LFLWRKKLLKDPQEILRIKELEKILKDDPKDIKSLIELGKIYYERKSFYKAEDCFERACEVDSGRAELYLKLSQTRLNLGKFSQAIDNLQRALDINSDLHSVYHTLALAHFNLGEFDQAKKCIYLGLNKEETSVLYQLLAHTCFCQEEYEETVEACRKAFEFKGWDIDLYMISSISLIKLGRLSEVEDLLEEAQERCTELENLSSIWLLLGNIYVENKNVKKAVECFRQGIKFNPNSADAYFSLCLNLIKTKDLQEARVCAEQTIKLDPDYKEAYGILASICLQLGDYDGCVQASKKALHENPDDENITIALAEALIRKNEADTAKSYLEDILQRKTSKALKKQVKKLLKKIS
jgi:tetratricopeptide (TPR) repeat protein